MDAKRRALRFLSVGPVGRPDAPFRRWAWSVR